ncbi:MAG: hypothetical protein CMH55_05365 [Myxococcales bacterium]|nr:hypothetical protein [Myxococcales bacterium]
MIYRLLVVVLLGLSACVTIHRVMTVPPVRKQLAKSAGQANKLFRGVQEGRLQRQRVLTRLYAEGANRQEEPYRGLQAHLSELAKVTRTVKGSHDKIQRHRQDFLALTKGRKRLRSDGHRYTQAHALIDKVKGELKTLQGLSNQARAQAKQFDRLAKKSRIKEVDATKLSAQLKKQTRKTRAEMTRFNGSLKKARGMMRQAGGRMSKDTRASRQKLLSQMRIKLANIEVQVAKIEGLAERFEIERRKRSKLLVGPGMVAFDVLDEVTAAGRLLRKEGAELQKLLQRFRAQ